MFVITGCTTRTAIIKTHPTDDAGQSMQSGKKVASTGHLEQGKRLYYRGKYNQAIKHLIRAIANDRKNWESYYFLGLSQQKKKQYDRSIGSFNNSLKYCPPNPLIQAKVHFSLGLSWEQEGYFHRAQEKYVLALDFNPKYTNAKMGIDRVKAKALKAEKNKKKKKKGSKAF
jgi:tetratricopeptide (TPR) repeat protein